MEGSVWSKNGVEDSVIVQSDYSTDNSDYSTVNIFKEMEGVVFM